MSRKDYILIADAIVSWIKDFNSKYGSNSGYDINLINEFSFKLSQDNSRFDSAKFRNYILKAVG